MAESNFGRLADAYLRGIQLRDQRKRDEEAAQLNKANESRRQKIFDIEVDKHKEQQSEKAGLKKALNERGQILYPSGKKENLLPTDEEILKYYETTGNTDKISLYSDRINKATSDALKRNYALNPNQAIEDFNKSRLAQQTGKLSTTEDPEIFKHETGLLYTIDRGGKIRKIADAPKDTGFTLGQGQQRFDAEGNLIAGVDPKVATPKKPEVFYEDTVDRRGVRTTTQYDKEGNIIKRSRAPLKKDKETSPGRVTPTANEISFELFGKPFTGKDLTSKERSIVLSTKKQRDLDLTEGKTAVVSEQKRRQPLTQSERKGWRLKGTFEQLPPNTTPEEAEKIGVQVTPSDLNALGALKNVKQIVGELDDLSRELITAENATEANILQAPKLFAGAKTGGIAKAKIYDDTKAAYTGVLSRSLGGEKGVLTDRDIERVVRALPSFNDTKEIRDVKMNSIKTLIIVAESAKRSVIQGDITQEEAQAQLTPKVNSLGVSQEESTQINTADDFLNKYGGF